MATVTQSMINVAEEASQAFTYNRATKSYCLEVHESDWVEYLVDQVLELANLPGDHYTNRWIFYSLRLIAEAHEGDLLAELEDGIEPDVYTSDLLQWLQSHPVRLAKSDDAIQIWGCRTIIDAISAAQEEERKSVFRVVADIIRLLVASN